MKRIVSFLGLLLLMGLVGMSAFAQEGVDDESNPNDPRENERANACYAGGTLEGKCDSELEWQAGWYLIRFEYGLISQDEMPTWLDWLFAEEAPASICYGFRGGGSASILLIGSLNSADNAINYTNASCSGTGNVRTMVQAANLAQAISLCQSLGETGAVSLYDIGYDLPQNYFGCT